MKNLINGLKGSIPWILTFILVIVIVMPVTAANVDRSRNPRRRASISHKAMQVPPIQLGTSGGWTYDLANGYCCGGTLGSLVQGSDGRQYILSNYHVFAGDVDDTDGIWSKAGEPIIHPSLIDVACNESNAQAAATLSDWADPLQGANLDAAIAEVVPGVVRGDGTILEIGTISSSTLAPSVSLAVKKSGRTTGLTRSKITGLHATISVSYDTECAGSSRGTATFVEQIVVGNKGSKFLAGGDSGSLMVEDVASNPRAVGLLYAGSFSVAIANPINEVLDYFGVTMVGVPGMQGAEVPVAEIERAKNAQQRNAARLERVPRAVGRGIGFGRDGRLVIKVYVEEDTPEVRAEVPDSVDGIPVEIEETGRIVAFTSCQ